MAYPRLKAAFCGVAAGAAAAGGIFAASALYDHLHPDNVLIAATKVRNIGMIFAGVVTSCLFTKAFWPRRTGTPEILTGLNPDID